MTPKSFFLSSETSETNIFQDLKNHLLKKNSFAVEHFRKRLAVIYILHIRFLKHEYRFLVCYLFSISHFQLLSLTSTCEIIKIIHIFLMFF